MAHYKTKIKLYLIANSKTWDNEKDNIELQDDGAGSYIKTWNVSGVTKPTDSQIASYETAGNTVESNSVIDSKRITEYLSWNEQLDKLYHDMTAGKLDATGEWHKAIKAVKDATAKPS